MVAVTVLSGCSDSGQRGTPRARASAGAVQPSTTSSPTAPTPPDHVVIVIVENHNFDQVLRSPGAPYFHQLVRSGRSLTRFYAITHPSQPNYIALFSGSTQGIRDDSCPHSFNGPNLGSALRSHGYTFVGYSQGLPKPGWTGCTLGDYARKHAPWVNFTNLPSTTNRPMTDFPTDYATLPTVSFVVPDLQHDMHDGTLAQSDAWVRKNISHYVTWAKTHNSLLVLTADEDDKSSGNNIPALVVGEYVRPGVDDHRYTLYSLLRTLEDWYGLPHLGNSATAAAITGLRR